MDNRTPRAVLEVVGAVLRKLGHDSIEITPADLEGIRTEESFLGQTRLIIVRASPDPAQATLPLVADGYSVQGSGYDSGATGYELQGRKPR